jgi:hypothetical protein
MDRSEMIALLQEHQCRVIFKKADGQERDMICTLRESDIPATSKNEAVTTTEVRSVNMAVIPAWDVNKQAWRSFRVDSVISFSHK